MSNSVSNPGRLYFWCQETDAVDRCDFLQWADGKTKVKKSTKKKSVLKRLQEKRTAVEQPKKEMKRIKPL